MLEIANLTKRFGPQTVIQNLSFTIARGERITLFARSGAGKTSLINILAGLDPHYEGRVSLAAANPATIFQEPRLFPYMTVEENIFLPLKLRKLALTATRREKYRRWLEVCQLAAFTAHYPGQLSGGMKQKVALVRGFITEPDFVMMDEPFKSIDGPAKQAIIHHLINTYPQMTVLFVTHTPEEVAMLAHSVLVFKDAGLEKFVEYNAAALNGALWAE